jgi:hypothetical protein
VVHDATGFGAKRVKRLEVIEPAIFPVQLPVALRVYVAFKFMKRPEEAGTGTGVAILATFRVWRFEVPETTSEVNVPTLVIFPWEGAVTDCDVGTVETFAPFMFEIPEPFEATKRPWTFSPVNVPTLVMLGWEARVTL